MKPLAIEPDVELLDIMVNDHNNADPRWQATAYWQEIAGPLIQHFRKEENIANFRRSPIRTGIRSALPSNEGRRPSLTRPELALAGLLKKIPLLGDLFRHQEEIIEMKVGEHANLFLHSLEMTYLVVKEHDLDKDVLDDKMAGNPDDVVEINGKMFSYRLLGYQNLYNQVIKRLSAAEITSVLELGSGYGGQAEVFLRKNPKLRYVALDIPPWLYIAEIYLKALFPNEVMGYRETRQINDKTHLLTMMKDRRIAIVPAWKWPFLADEFDLFWNSKSLQEMNENADKYIANAINSCQHVFLHAYSTGKSGVHNPAYLREKVMTVPVMRELMWEKDLLAGKDSMSMLFKRA
jgi:putative sugar O-methyltransferase